MPSFYMALHASARQEEETLRRGPWLEEEDEQLIAFVNVLGDRRWDYIAQVSGLRRSGKSCRLRWKNYLRPNLKHGNISEEEQQIILQLQAQWGNKWSKIARFLPGRTDNEIKNYWKTRMRKMSQHDRAHQESHLTNINQDFTVQHKDEEDSNPERQCSPGADSLTSAGSSLNTFGDPSEFQSVISSPYEARFLDWACESSWNPMSGVETKEYELQGTNFEQYPSWKLEEEQEEEETNTWDCPISLWK